MSYSILISKYAELCIKSILISIISPVKYVFIGMHLHICNECKQFDRSKKCDVKAGNA